MFSPNYNCYHLMLVLEDNKPYEIVNTNNQDSAVGMKNLLECMQQSNLLNKAIKEIRIEVR